MTLEGRIARLEAVAPMDIDSEIERELAKLTPEQQAQFLAAFEREYFGQDTERTNEPC